MADPLLEASRLSFAYDGTRSRLFNGISLSVGPGELLSVLGPNGVGKTTLLHCLTGAHKPLEGRVRCGGAPLEELSPPQRARRIAVVHQTQESTFAYTVESVVLLGRAANIGLFARPTARDHAVAAEAMQRVGVSGLARRPIGELSGGERQLVMIARALAQQAPLLALDEPTSHLDLANQARVLVLLKSLLSDGHGIVMTTHYPEHALALGGTALLLGGAAGSCTGPVGKIVTESQLSKAFRTRVALLRDGNTVACTPRLSIDPELS